MAVAGFRITLRRGATPTAASAAAMTHLGNGIWQIQNTARRVVDPSAVWSLVASGVTVSAASVSNASTQLLFGQVSTISAASMVMNYSYVPLDATELFAAAKEFTLNEQADLLETNVFTASTDVTQRQYGLRDYSMNINMLLNTTDMALLATRYFNSTLTFLEINMAQTGSSYLFRGIGLIENIERKGVEEGLVEASISWKGTNFISSPQTTIFTSYNERIA
jgi:hypothetical protein